MYNFGMSSTLKAWFDHVLRAGVTFRYTANGPGRAAQRQEGGRDREPRRPLQRGRAAAMDGQEPHLRTLLGFMGIDDVTFVRAEKLAFGPEAADGVDRAKRRATLTASIRRRDASAARAA